MKQSWKRRRFMLWALILLLGGTIWLGVYAWDQGFTKKWRGLIKRELARHGLRAEIGRLTIDPVEGLTARDVKLFDITHRDQHLADIDRISLDIDLVRLVNSEDFLRTLHLQKADVALPVDPGDPRSEWLTIRDLNARLVFHEDQIEIAHAEGQVSGVLVTASGTVSKPAPQAVTPAEKERRREERTRQLQEMRDRRGALRTVLRALDRFRVPENLGVPVRPHKAALVLEIQGDLSDIDAMDIRASLSGGALVHRGGAVEGFEAVAQLSDGLLTLQRLEIKDRHGAMHASASWQIREADGVDFSVDCDMDLQALLRSALDEAPWLGEVVCYTPPGWSWDGKWLLEAPEKGFPVEGQGRVKAGRWSTRGVVFEGLEAKVALQEGGQVYVRDGILRHQSGEIEGQAMGGLDGGRYVVDWRMAPGAILPFLPQGKVRDALNRAGFDRLSQVDIRMEGDRSGTAAGWRHSGWFQLRDVTWDGTALKEVAAEVAINPAAAIPVVFRKAVLELADGSGQAEEIRLDSKEGLLHLEGAAGTIMPLDVVQLFVPRLSLEMEKYRFSKPPETRLAGVIDLRGLERSEYRIALRARNQCGLDIAGAPFLFDQADGMVQISGRALSVQLNGRMTAGMEAFKTLQFEEAAPVTFSGRFPLGREAGFAPSWEAGVRSAGRVGLQALGRTWPLDQFTGRMESDGVRIAGTGGAQFLDGNFGASLEFDDHRSIAHEGSIVIRNASFARIAAIMDPSRKTEGRLTGSFSYQVPAEGHSGITGAGEAVLEDANIFALPLLGPLSTLLAVLLPEGNVGYSVARTATATFKVADEKVLIPDFEAATRTFKLTASGVTDYVRDEVDFLARVNLRGPPGLLLYPVSKLFEYAADGTMADPAWHPRFLAGPFRDKPRAAGDPDSPKPAPPIRAPGNR